MPAARWPSSEDAARSASSSTQPSLVSEIDCDELLALDEALEKFAKEDAKKAKLVKLRYFAGLSVQEAADCLGISRATADRYWAYAKVWLYREVHGGTS